MTDRLGGASGPVLTFHTDSAELAWTGELTECTIESDTGASTVLSNYEGDTDEPWFIKGEAVQSVVASSLWRFTWDHSGESFPYTFAPLGNSTASIDAPHLTGVVTIGPRAPIGGKASDETFVFQFDWKLTGQPVVEDGS